MRTWSRLMLLLLSTCALFARADAAFAEGKVQTIIGIVQVESEDEDGNVLSVFLEAEENDYGIAASAKGKELFEQIGQRVKVTGVVVEDDVGDMVIQVTAFEIVSPNPDGDRPGE